MATLIGVFVDRNYNIFVRKGDSGSIVIRNIPIDHNYKVSLGIVNPDNGNIVKEISTNSLTAETAQINISTSDTESIGEGKWLYGIKLSYNGEETTVIPNAYKNTGGCLDIPLPPTFNVLPKLVEG